MTTAALCAACAFARPDWPEPPLGTFSASFGGGGVARGGGAGALFVNPAALEIPGGFQAEAGMMSIAGGVFPYGVFGSQATASSDYALGYFFDREAPLDTIQLPARQGLMGGGSWKTLRGAPGDALDFLELGAAAHTFGTEEIFGVDVDAGARARLWRRVVLGAAAKNLLESGVGQKPAGYESPRRYLLSAGLEAPSLSLWKLRLRRTSLYYEARASGFPPEGFVHALSAGGAFVQDGVLGVRATVLLPQEGVLFFAGGFTLRLQLGSGLLTCAYAITSGDGHEGDVPTHSFSFNFSTFGRADRMAPAVSVQADHLELDPAGGEAGWVHFRVTASDRIPEDEQRAAGETGDEIGRLRAWTLAIDAVGSDGRDRGPARVFRGRDLPPRLIRWEGRDDSGAVLPPGYYSFRLSAEDAAGNRGVTSPQLLRIVAPPPADSLDLGTEDPKAEP